MDFAFLKAHKVQECTQRCGSLFIEKARQFASTLARTDSLPNGPVDQIWQLRYICKTVLVSSLFGGSSELKELAVTICCIETASAPRSDAVWLDVSYRLTRSGGHLYI